MNVDYVKWEFYGKAFTWISNVVLWIYVIISNRHRVTTSKIEKIKTDTDEKFIDHNTRIVCLETDFKHLPNKEELKDLAGKLEISNEKLHKLTGRFEGINRLADIMNEYLINKSEKGK